MGFKKRAVSAITALCMTFAGTAVMPSAYNTALAESSTVSMDWGAVKIGGGGFVSGIITGKNSMYARTDVGGAYRYDYDKSEWVQLLDFVNETDRGFLSVDAFCVDPTDDDTLYLLCGCAYFSDERTVIFKSTDGGRTFTEHDVTNLIKVHGNGYGRQCGEAIAVDPDNPDVIYCGGDTEGLIMSKDGGETWAYVDSFNDLGLFTNEIKWPLWKDIKVKTTVGSDYTSCNGIGTIAIDNGKVYVGVSDNTIGANVYVADVGKDNWKPLSADLPTKYFPSRISKDSNGNIFITYVAGLAFDGSAGGAYKYDPKTDTVKNISPVEAGFGSVFSDPENPERLVATTCGVWYSQMWAEWTDEHGAVWGDRFFKSEDGGETWISMTPGNKTGWGGPLEAEYLKDGGYSWIQEKAIHWCGAMVIDPRDSNKVIVTSGNGVFACDNTWDETPQFYFDPTGIEEVVALDMVSVPGGDEYSAIGDYDGFIHTDVSLPGEQYQPNIGSTSAIAYCPAASEYMVRLSQNNAKGYYSKDSGKTWTEMATCPNSGGKAALTKLADRTIRIFVTGDGSVSYSDDFGGSWTKSTGLDASKPVIAFVDIENPKYVYAYTAKYNEYWASNPNNKEPSLEDAHYSFMVSDDYGATFTSKTICAYDMCDVANRIGYLGEGKMVVGAGWNGAYRITDYGKTVEKLDSVSYCKSIGYGAAEKSGGLCTLYMYGKPQASDPEGLYRSTDGGDSWVCINTDKLYGGTGNGNFLVGDMNEFGTVYMSTVGCGIVYGKLSSGQPSTNPTTKPTASSKTVYGDANCDGKVDISDAVMVKCYLINNKTYGISAQGLINADVQGNGNGVNAQDAVTIQKYVIKIITALPI